MQAISNSIDNRRAIKHGFQWQTITRECDKELDTSYDKSHSFRES